MKKIFYWSPYLSNVATIKNVLDSAYSLTKYGKNCFEPYIIDVMGEWKNKKKNIIEKKVNYLKLGSSNIRLPISGFFKSRLISIYIYFHNLIPLFFLIKKEKPNYLIIHLLTSIPLTLLILFNFKTKFILRISGLPKLNFFRKLLWKLVAKKLFLITCPSRETVDYIVETKIFEKNKVVLLQDPIINISEIMKKKKKIVDVRDLKNSFFLSIGRLTKQKNHQILIDLFVNLNKKKKNNYLYIIGDGEEKEELQKKIFDSNLQNNIFLLGYKKNVYPYILLSKAIISPSLWEDPGAVMIEAAFCNKVVISSDCKNGPKEFLMNNKAGYLFENGKLASLVNVVSTFMEDSQIQIYEKKKLAKINSKKYTIFNHFTVLRKFLI